MDTNHNEAIATAGGSRNSNNSTASSSNPDVSCDEEQSIISEHPHSFQIKTTANVAAVREVPTSRGNPPKQKMCAAVRQQKRRLANRMSARKCRMRRKEQLEQLESEVRHLSSECTNLARLNETLRDELIGEVSNALNGNYANAATAMLTIMQQFAPTLLADPVLNRLLWQRLQQPLSNGGSCNRSPTNPGASLGPSWLLAAPVHSDIASMRAGELVSVTSSVAASLENHQNAPSTIPLTQVLDSNTLAFLKPRNGICHQASQHWFGVNHPQSGRTHSPVSHHYQQRSPDELAASLPHSAATFGSGLIPSSGSISNFASNGQVMTPFLSTPHQANDGRNPSETHGLWSP